MVYRKMVMVKASNRPKTSAIFPMGGLMTAAICESGYHGKMEPESLTTNNTLDNCNR
jgi:hypothetical protein